jgi:glycosyltransferase involved in cell wall biosynthesis
MEEIKNDFGRKIRVLVVPSDRTGVGYYRSTKPHMTLEKNYPDEFHVDIDFEPKLNDKEWLSKYDIVHYHRNLGSFETMQSTLDRLDELGIVSFMDIDDYWAPGNHHPAHMMIKQAGLDKKIPNNIRLSKNVITTTDVFAEEISKLNKNVYVLPNAIDPTEKQFQNETKKSDRIRIGWLGGSSHLEDLKLLKGLVTKLKGDKLIDKVQFVLCGYDTRGMVTTIDQKTGQQTQRPIKPHESVWYEYEKIFTDDFKIVSPEYKAFLHEFSKSDYPDVNNEPYRRVWTKPISTYASNYNMFDISLAPLVTHTFNKVKSQLKVIEAGFHKKALVAQDFGPYKIDLTSAKDKGGEFNDNGNALLVDTAKNHKQWYQHLKYLITNPDKIEVLGNRLYETVKDTYSVDSVTAKRRELYLKVLAESKKSETVESV